MSTCLKCQRRCYTDYVLPMVEYTRITKNVLVHYRADNKDDLENLKNENFLCLDSTGDCYLIVKSFEIEFAAL